MPKLVSSLASHFSKREAWPWSPPPPTMGRPLSLVHFAWFCQSRLVWKFSVSVCINHEPERLLNNSPTRFVSVSFEWLCVRTTIGAAAAAPRVHLPDSNFFPLVRESYVKVWPWSCGALALPSGGPAAMIRWGDGRSDPRRDVRCVLIRPVFVVVAFASVSVSRSRL